MNIVVFINPQQVINEYWDAVVTNMSENDKAGIEFALQLKEKKGGKVTAVSIGTEDADTALREALAMGVDDAALMWDEDATIDYTKKVVAALQKVSGDVYISGRADVEMEDVAQQLGAAKKQCTEVDLNQFPEQVPLFVFAQASAFDPRHMSVGGVFSAYRREIEMIPTL
jgi:electron transfer flavoprotein beta subunit